MAFKFNISQGEEWLLKAASVGAALLGVVAVYTFYRNNIWHPTVVVKEVDFKNGIADLEINGRPFVLRGDSSYLIGFDWGIRFGFLPTAEGRRVYDRIEVLKRGMVNQVIRQADKNGSFTGFDERTFWNDAFEGGKGGLYAVKSFTGEESKLDSVWNVKSSDSFSIFAEK
jgi:hypothetical protein